VAYLRLLGQLSAAVRLVLIALGLVMAALIATEVFCRYVLNASLFFAEEASRFLFVWFCLLGAGLAFQAGAHVGVDLLRHRLPHRAARAVGIASACCVLAFLAGITAGSLQILPYQWDQTMMTLGIRIFWAYLAIPTGAVFMMLHVGGQVVRLVADAGGPSDARPGSA
jgi:TRAP-type C4-dicarboxylate transport system permease small subunit